MEEFTPEERLESVNESLVRNLILILSTISEIMSNLNLRSELLRELKTKNTEH